MQFIENQNFPHERDLYGADGITLKNCTFDGVEDGESALKEASVVKIESCRFNLRYPLWHCRDVEIDRATMTENCRAALWYTKNVTIKNSKLFGIKALRECSRVAIAETTIVSPEFGWKSRNLEVTDSEVESEYAFLMAQDIRLKNVNFVGKYAFQYVESAVIENCHLDTKDALWHAKDVTVKNTTIKGEYFAWYSQNLTLINCKIIGTQPLCYCDNLTLINCETENADFAFEYSDVNAEIIGNILSVKNPKRGKIVADSITEIILTADSKHESHCAIVQKSHPFAT